ncbi:unnamed protein product [Aureobasidium uvarum]|uniref:Uncharacterized protein n=1 Tax=Aureobasidium uvarum TaxID=2773716 RepID=A0A9N8KFF7_9PEZI|nr:unnamed protein product [Aureobasidium uvarum]
MAAFFNDITQALTTLAINDPIQHDRGHNPVINPKFPDFSTSTYAARGRDIRFTPEPTGPMRPNFIPDGPSTRLIGRFYPTDTSMPMCSLDVIRPLQTVGTLRSQSTVGRWKAMCDNCFEHCAEGFWEKACQINTRTKQTTSAVRFMGRCNKCGRSFAESVSGI